MAGEPIILDYAKGVPRWRKWVRRWVVGVTVVGVAGAVWLGWRRYYDPVRDRYWQSQCLGYMARASDVAFEPDKELADRLVRDRAAEYRRMYSLGHFHACAGLTPSCWDHLSPRSACLPATATQEATVFLHERQTRGGPSARRLVRVIVAYAGSRVSIETYVYDPATMPMWCLSGPGVGGGWVPIVTPTMRLYVGQPDRSDPSHFTFDCEEKGIRTTVDGWLETGDTVTLKVRP